MRYSVPARHPLMAWLVRHAADVVNWNMRGPDRLTAYQRVRPKPFRTRLLGCGEMCSYKVRARELLPSSGDGRRWHVGAFIGVDRRTGQYMIHDGGEIKYARTIQRMPEANAFRPD